MNYADEIKATLDKMSTDLHQELRLDMIDKVRHHIKQTFTKQMKDRAMIVFDPTINEVHYEQYTDCVMLGMPKIYYYSTVEWLKSNGFRVHVNASEFPNITKPKRVKAIVQL